MLALVFLCSCEREHRRFAEPPAWSDVHAETHAKDELHPGDLVDGGSPNGDQPIVHTSAYPYEQNAWAVAEGKRLWIWFNCNGCHAYGGGGMGPPLMDDQWNYGWDPSTIYDSIAGGRPYGMPAFRGKVPEQQIWELVAYVRSMSGQLRLDVEPGRDDAMSVKSAESTKPRERPHAADP